MQKTVLFLFIILFAETFQSHANFHNVQIVNENYIHQLEVDDQHNLIFITQYNNQAFIYKTDSTNQNVFWKYQLPDTCSFTLLKVYQNEEYVLLNTTGHPVDYCILLKLDSDGNLKWSKKISTVSHLRCNAICVTAQKKIYLGSGVCGYSNFVISLDSSGNSLWTKTYNFSGAAGFIAGLKECDNGNLIVSSWSLELANGHRVAVLFKINAAGTILWDRFYEIPFFSSDAVEYPSISTDSKKNIYLNGNIYDTLYTNCYNVILKTDSLGSLQWCNYYPSPAVAPSNIIPNYQIDPLDNINAVNEYYNPVTHATANMVIRMSSADGSVKSVLTDLGSPGSLFYVLIHIQPIHSNKFILSTSNNNAIVAEIDSLGNGFCTLYPGNLNAVPFSLIEFSASLSTGSNTFNYSDITVDLIERSSQTLPFCSNVGLHEIQTELSVSLYPNPVTDLLHFSPEFKPRSSSFFIFNNLGQIVLSGEVDKSEINISKLNKGIYYFVVTDKKTKLQAHKRFVKAE